MSSIITADYVSQLRKNALEAAVKDLVRMKTDNPNSKITKKTYENVKSSLEEVGVVIKLDALYKRVSRAFDKINKVTTPVQEVDVSPQSEARSQVSDLSSSPNNDRTSTPTSGTNETMDNNGSTIATGDNTFGTELPRKEVGGQRVPRIAIRQRVLKGFVIVLLILRMFMLLSWQLIKSYQSTVKLREIKKDS